jgi:glucose uptake protein GlcU
MFDKIKGIHIQNIIALIIIVTCAIIVLVTRDAQLTQKFFDMGLVGVIGWAFTQSKQKNTQP